MPNNGFGGAFDGELYFKPMPFADQTGAVAAIRGTTGERVWYTKLPRAEGSPPVPAGRGGGGGGGGASSALLACNTGIWASASAISGAVFAGSRNGVLRAFAANDGKVIWEFATARKFDTVNGTPGAGGGIGGTAPTIVDGIVYMGSGYAILGGAPGNVLLAFGID